MFALARCAALLQCGRACLFRAGCMPIMWPVDDTLILTVNGEARAFGAPLTVAGLLAAIGLDTRKVAVERNEEIVARSDYGGTRLAAGDQLEIVHFIGGG